MSNQIIKTKLIIPQRYFPPRKMVKGKKRTTKRKRVFKIPHRYVFFYLTDLQNQDNNQNEKPTPDKPKPNPQRLLHHRQIRPKREQEPEETIQDGARHGVELIRYNILIFILVLFIFGLLIRKFLM